MAKGNKGFKVVKILYVLHVLLMLAAGVAWIVSCVSDDLPEALRVLCILAALPVLLGRFLFIPYIVGAVLTGFYIHGLRKWDRSSGTVTLFVVLLVLSIVGYVVMELLFANMIDGLMSV